MAERIAGKLGALPVTNDPRTLKLARYLTPGLGAPPPAKDWLSPVPAGQWGMLANDRYGCCVPAAAGHMQQLWTASDAGRELTVTDRQVLAAYTAITGFNPNDPSTDQGTDPLDALTYWRRHGICGHKIGAFVEIDVASRAEVQWAITLFGAVFAAIAFPSSAMDQFNRGVPWSVVLGSRSEGGHMITLGAYDQHGIDCITWGARQRLTYGFWDRYQSAGFAVLSSQWTGPDGKSPAGVNVEQLRADLAALPATR